jgi:hypothetical protein
VMSAIETLKKALQSNKVRDVQQRGGGCLVLTLSDGSKLTLTVDAPNVSIRVDHDTRGACSACGGSGWLPPADPYGMNYAAASEQPCSRCNAPTYPKGGRR